MHLLCYLGSEPRRSLRTNLQTSVAALSDCSCCASRGMVPTKDGILTAVLCEVPGCRVTVLASLPRTDARHELITSLLDLPTADGIGGGVLLLPHAAIALCR